MYYYSQPYASFSEMSQFHSSSPMINAMMAALGDHIKNCTLLWKNGRMVFFYSQIWFSQCPTSTLHASVIKKWIQVTSTTIFWSHCILWFQLLDLFDFWIISLSIILFGCFKAVFVSPKSFNYYDKRHYSFHFYPAYGYLL